MKIGQIVKAKLSTEVNSRGEIGLCFEAFGTLDKPGYGIIFEGGGYDSFNQDEVDRILVISDHIDESLADYKFSNVIWLREDYREGKFNKAFETGALWRAGFDLSSEQYTNNI